MLKIEQTPSSFFDERPTGIQIDTIVVHSMYDPQCGERSDFKECFELLNANSCSAHYFVRRDGAVVQTVDEHMRAWHAGVSKMLDGREAVNGFSIGIELIGVDGVPFTDEQYTSLIDLISEIASRHPIRSVVGHSHIAMPLGRKSDPWNSFSWERLKNGLTDRALSLFIPA